MSPPPNVLPRAHALFAWLWLLAALPFGTDAACNMVAGLALFLFWSLLAFLWLFIGLEHSPLSPPDKRWWLSAGVAGLAGPALAFTDVGLLARVAVSRPWLEAHAAKVVPGEHESLHEPRLVGLFLVDRIEERDGAVLLYTSSGFLNRYGLVYIPQGQAPPPHVRQVHHLVGRWHRFEWKF